jgi:transposase
MGVKRRRTHSREFKVEAVRKVLVDDRTPQDVGAEIDVKPGLVSRWVKELGKDPSEAFPGKGQRKSKDQEIHELKRELEQTRQERDILKKAVAVFSKYQSG